MEFNRLRSYSAGGDHRRARSNGHNSDRAQSETDSLPDFDQYWRRLNLSNGRNRRSISETEAQLMNLSSVKSIGPFQKERFKIFWFLWNCLTKNLKIFTRTLKRLEISSLTEENWSFDQLMWAMKETLFVLLNLTNIEPLLQNHFDCKLLVSF